MSLTKLLVNLKDDLENLNNTIEELVIALEQGQSAQNEEPDFELPAKPKIKLEDVRKELAKRPVKVTQMKYANYSRLMVLKSCLMLTLKIMKTSF